MVEIENFTDAGYNKDNQYGICDNTADTSQLDESSCYYELPDKKILQKKLQELIDITEIPEAWWNKCKSAYKL